MTVSAGLIRDDLIKSLRQLEPDLRAKGVTGLAIFGSRSRGDHRTDSDLDILIDVEAGAKNPLYIAFDAQHVVHDALGVETQASLSSELRDRFADRIADDIIRIF